MGRTTSKPRSNDATTKTTSTSTSTSPSSTTTSNQKARLDSSYSHSLGECPSFRIMPVLSGEVLWYGSVGVLERNLKFRRRGRVCFLYSRWSPIHYSNLSYSLETGAMTMLPSKKKKIPSPLCFLFLCFVLVCSSSATLPERKREKE